jgi:branched-chain amino acid transport system permease protein
MLLIQQIISGLMLGGIYVLVALSFTLSIGVLNFLNFSIPGLFMLAGMSCWGLMRAGAPFILAALGAIVVAALASLIVERFTWRAMRQRFGDATEHAMPLVSSLGFLLLFENSAQIVFGSDLQTFPALFGDSNWRIAGLVISAPQLAGLCLSVAIVWLLTLVLARTDLGRGLRGVAENPEAAALMGVEVGRLVPALFCMCGVLAAIGGIVFAVNYLQVSPRMGDDVATMAMAAMVIGGLGNIWGAVAGGLVVGLAEVLSIHFFGSGFVKVTVWSLLLAILIIRPTGLFGKVSLGKGKF